MVPPPASWWRPTQTAYSAYRERRYWIIIDNETNSAGQELTNNHIKQGQETNQIWTHEVGTQDTHDRGLT